MFDGWRTKAVPLHFKNRVPPPKKKKTLPFRFLFSKITQVPSENKGSGSSVFFFLKVWSFDPLQQNHMLLQMQILSSSILSNPLIQDVLEWEQESHLLNKKMILWQTNMRHTLISGLNSSNITIGQCFLTLAMH